LLTLFDAKIVRIVGKSSKSATGIRIDGVHMAVKHEIDQFGREKLCLETRYFSFSDISAIEI
jgi:hypothetical protein